MAQIDNTYNGWTTYATWRVNMEIFDRLTLKELSLEFDSDNPHGEYELGKFLRGYAERIISNNEIINNNLTICYAMAFLSEVDWTEIAKHMINKGSV